MVFSGFSEIYTHNHHVVFYFLMNFHETVYTGVSDQFLDNIGFVRLVNVRNFRHFSPVSRHFSGTHRSFTYLRI